MRLVIITCSKVSSNEQRSYCSSQQIVLIMRRSAGSLCLSLSNEVTGRHLIIISQFVS